MMFDGPKPPYTQSRISHRLKIPYYVNPAEVEDYGNKKFRKLDEMAENRYIHQVNVRCEYEHQQQARLEQEARGWGFLIDQIKLEQARQMDMPNCRRLNELGIKY
jgi:DnaJ homolog subfamily B member 12